MKINTPILGHAAVAMICIMLASGCKTTEANYKAAYETTVAHRNEKGADDVPGMKAAGTPEPKDIEAAPGLTLPVITAWIGSTSEDGVAHRDSVKLYNVVVARFRQIFNARQMAERLRASGYGNATVLRTNDAYFVSTATTSSPQEAQEALRHVADDQSLRLRSPYPLIVRPNHLAR